jgi:hypothetical protein
MSQIEIARQLQVSEASISSDVQYLREQAKDSISSISSKNGGSKESSNIISILGYGIDLEESK